MATARRFGSGSAGIMDPSLKLPAGLSWFDMLLPPQAVPFIVLLLLILPLVLLTAESLFLPLLEGVKPLFGAADTASFNFLPFHFYLKLGAFLVLAFLGGFQLLMRIKTIYYEVWAKAFPRPHTLHVDYYPQGSRSMAALLQWKLYQTGVILLPPLVVGGITALVGLVFLYLFNTFSDMAFVGLSIQFTIELFVMMMLGLFTGFACLNSLWNVLTTVFGDVIAVTEPDLPNSLILQRCNRIAFASKWTYLLLPAYGLWCLGALGGVIWLLMEVDIHQLIGFQANYGAILLAEVVFAAWYLAFNFFKFYTYHQGLVAYYHKLPAQLKECFSPPPPAWQTELENDVRASEAY